MLMLAILFFIGALVCGAIAFPAAGPVALPVVGFFLLLLASDLALLFAPPFLRGRRDALGMPERRV